MTKPALAAQLYTLRDYMKTPDDIRAGLKKVSEIGYRSVQVSAIGDIDWAELRNILDENALTVCATHTSFDDILERTEQVAQKHHTVGCPLVGIGSGGNTVFGEHITLEGYQELAKKLNEAGEKLRGYGLRFAYHNHSAEFRRLENSQTGMDYLIENTDPALVGFILDTYWVQAGGASPCEYIRRLKGRIEVVHFKDMAVDEHNHSIISEIGGGNLNWRDILASCEETGIKTAAVEQDTCPRDPFDCLRASYDYLHGCLGMQ